jgi:ABC-type transport system involved in Fe-S cluster assembly fused permease/ATPase subunit
MRRLLFRFYDASSGSVRVGGHDVRQLTLKSLRHAIAQVPQVLSMPQPPAMQFEAAHPQS